MGPLFGIIMVDYYLIARGQIQVDELYREHGRYRYQGGWHVKALVAAGIGILFSTILPNFSSLLPSWWGLYGWFFGVAIGGATYWGLRMLPEFESDEITRQA
jgi:nucleobase:cation symporter-1, NCS1 family